MKIVHLSNTKELDILAETTTDLVTVGKLSTKLKVAPYEFYADPQGNPTFGLRFPMADLIRLATTDH
jgi:hypothetical protein